MKLVFLEVYSGLKALGKAVESDKNLRIYTLQPSNPLAGLCPSKPFHL